MFNKLEILTLSGDVARHASARQSLVARNIANANTPGYRSFDIAAFQPAQREFSDALRQTRPGHFQTPLVAGQEPREMRAGVKPNGNGVSLQTEMLKGAEIRHQHQMAVAVYGNAIDILRSSIGRR